ncbi:MAG: ATP-binding protein [Paludibacteraceae bacterium]|nr:ATP-binding protein [Paludibacteraceae bacterium]
MFYDENTANDVERLTNLLSKEHFSGIQQRLKEANLRNGFAVLLYGAPGTGKTETVLQLAKATGRDIMQVNYEDLKSKYVGDSEKEVKRLFAEYAEAVEGSEHAPILLFNEADGLLGKRKQGAENAVDKMENTVQNIILQEMEKLNGIMIATTNLTCNFDSAFERRFLYKIKYDKPGQQVREHIWHSMLGELSDNDVKQLASEYDFSGGEIENIARKQKVEYILSGNSVTLDQIRQFCDREKIVTESGNHKRVGFC